MVNSSLARKAGIIGMAGAGLWAVSIAMQFSFGLFGPGSGPLWPIHQIIALTALTGMVIGFLGLVWGGAVQGRFGVGAVYTYALAWTLIIIAGLLGLLLQTEDSPVFILYPIGGLLSDVGGFLTGIAVLIAKRWSGWQRWAPLVSFLILFFAVNLPGALSASDGPGMIGELIMGACWFTVGLAVFTAQPRQPTVLGSVAAKQAY